MPGPAIWTGGNSDGSNSLPNTTIEEGAVPSTVPSTTPSSVPVSEAHNAENCNGGKLARTRRAFREMLFKA
jgi:hypothetical protein